jgi:hypothetical protein
VWDLVLALAQTLGYYKESWFYISFKRTIEVKKLIVPSERMSSHFALQWFRLGLALQFIELLIRGEMAKGEMGINHQKELLKSFPMNGHVSLGGNFCVPRLVTEITTCP